MRTKSITESMKIYGLIGLCIGAILFIVMQLFKIPIVIGTVSYGDITASLLLLIASTILFILIGLIISIFNKLAGR